MKDADEPLPEQKPCPYCDETYDAENDRCLDKAIAEIAALRSQSKVPCYIRAENHVRYNLAEDHKPPTLPESLPAGFVRVDRREDAEQGEGGRLCMTPVYSIWGGQHWTGDWVIAFYPILEQEHCVWIRRISDDPT